MASRKVALLAPAERPFRPALFSQDGAFLSQRFAFNLKQALGEAL
jgi:hypothetical protein